MITIEELRTLEVGDRLMPEMVLATPEMIIKFRIEDGKIEWLELSGGDYFTEIDVPLDDSFLKLYSLYIKPNNIKSVPLN